MQFSHVYFSSWSTIIYSWENLPNPFSNLSILDQSLQSYVVFSYLFGYDGHQKIPTDFAQNESSFLNFFNPINFDLKILGFFLYF